MRKKSQHTHDSSSSFLFITVLSQSKALLTQLSAITLARACAYVCLNWRLTRVANWHVYLNTRQPILFSNTPYYSLQVFFLNLNVSSLKPLKHVLQDNIKNNNHINNDNKINYNYCHRYSYNYYVIIITLFLPLLHRSSSDN